MTEIRVPEWGDKVMIRDETDGAWREMLVVEIAPGSRSAELIHEDGRGHPGPVRLTVATHGEVWRWPDVGEQKYTFQAMDAGSAKYGLCEICDERVDSTWLRTEFVAYPRDVIDQTELDDPAAVGWRHNGNVFGHRDCLARTRWTEKVLPDAVSFETADA